jgi:hypothetical protein
MHLGGLGQAILAMGSASSDLLGEPSDELRAQLKDSPIRIFTLFLSLERLTRCRYPSWSGD